MTDDLLDAATIAAEIDSELAVIATRRTADVRALRRRFSRRLQAASPALMLKLALTLVEQHGDTHRWVAYELVREHAGAYASLDAAKLEQLGAGIGGWHAVDAFARTLSGPAWLDGLIDDDVVHRWAHADDLWWRRTALVSTVALNMRSHGGLGDVVRTLAICRLLVSDHEDMIVKALSWALRELIVHDRQAVVDFLKQHDEVLAARVKREVRNKLETGLKNPK